MDRHYPLTWSDVKGVEVVAEDSHSATKRTAGEAVVLERVVHIWPCWNCNRLTTVDRMTFTLLSSGTLLGIRCGGCLLPPQSGLVAA